MKKRYLKIFLLLIGFYSIKLFGLIKNYGSNLLERYNLRFLVGTNSNYDKSARTDQNDLKSIENCENSDINYFYEYITGHNVTFDKEIDETRAVSYINNNKIFYFIGATYSFTKRKWK